MKTIVVTFMAAALAACALGPFQEDSPYSTIPVGSKLILKRELTVPFDSVSAWVSRAGDPPADVMAQQRDVNCQLDMWKRAPKSRTVVPDEFIVTKVRAGTDYVGLGPRQVAALDLAGSDAGAPVYEVRSVTLYLRSNRQPDVYALRCEYYDIFGEGYPLGVGVIRWAIGGDFELQLAE